MLPRGFLVHDSSFFLFLTRKIMTFVYILIFRVIKLYFWKSAETFRVWVKLYATGLKFPIHRWNLHEKFVIKDMTDFVENYGHANV